MPNAQKKTLNKKAGHNNGDNFAKIEINRKKISKMLSGSTTKRLNNFNWLRHEISTTEPRCLFQINVKDQAPTFDYSCTRGLGEAYDYILKRGDDKKQPLTIKDVCNIHYLICNGTNISINDTYIHAGVIKKTSYPMEIEYKLENIISKATNPDKPAFIRAFDLHYEIVMLQAFDDYNKRTARLAMNLALVLNGYRPMSFTRQIDKKQYTWALLQMKRGDKKAYYDYMVKAMLASQDRIIKQLKQSKIY